MKVRWTALLLGAIAAQSAALHAAVPNVALNMPVISGSGSYPADPFNNPFFPASNVTNGLYYEPNSGTQTYWLGREGVVNESFVVDLGVQTPVLELRLRNTHNGFCGCNDRSTNDFQVYGSNAVDGLNNLIAPTLLITSSLPRVDNLDPVPSTGFNSTNGLTPGIFRYLEFRSLSTTQSPPNVGLNEFEVYTEEEPNIALGKPVVSGTGSYYGPYNDMTFGAFHVTDGRLDDKDHVNGQPSYWLGREQTPNESFVVDLEAVHNINRIDLQNAINRQYLDRSTDKFNVQVSTAGPSGPWQPLLSGNLSIPNTIHPSAKPIDIFEFPTTAARWVRFEAETYVQPNPTCCTGAGLSEMFVYEAVDNLALHRPIIKTSGEYQFASGFEAANVTDGSTTDEFQYNYWLGRETTQGESFTLDLGNAYALNEVRLRNTHNAQFNDRGTDEFIIWAATAVDGNNDLINPYILLSGNLTNADGTINLPTDVFAVNGTARYLQFVALSSNDPSGNVGLNEIEVYGAAVPEPSTLALAGFAALGLVFFRRVRGKTAATN